MNFCDFNGSGLASSCFSFSISTAAERLEADSRIPGLSHRLGSRRNPTTWFTSCTCLKLG